MNRANAISAHVAGLTFGLSAGAATAGDFGDRIEHRLDRLGDRAGAAGRHRLAVRLDRKGDRINRRLDLRGNRIDARLARRAYPTDRRLDRRGARFERRH